MVVRRASSILRNEDAARDVLHEIFTSLLERPEQLPSGKSLAGWFYAATTNACLNRLRDMRNRERLMDEKLTLPPATSHASPETVSDVRRVLAHLSETEAVATAAFHLGGMSHQQIAGLLLCSRRHVGDLLERASARLKELA